MGVQPGPVVNAASLHPIPLHGVPEKRRPALQCPAG